MSSGVRPRSSSLRGRTLGVNGLAANHLADLRASGLTDETITAGGFYTVTDPKEIGKLLGWKGPARKLGACLVIPYHGADGKPPTYTRGKQTLPFVRVKPDSPLPNKSGTGKRKYEQPKGSGLCAYFPLATRAVLTDASIPLLLTEGEKKSACADQHGLPCVAIGGVWSFALKREKGPDGKKGPRVLIPDLARVAWLGRIVYIVYDSDATTNPDVMRAEWRLAEVLAARGAEVRVVRLPAEANGDKNGLDDFIVRHGADALRNLIGSATKPSKPKSDKPNDDPDNPHLLASGFLKAVSPPTGQPYLLRFWRGDFHKYECGAYQSFADTDLRGWLAEWIRAEFVKLNLAAMDNAGEKGPPPTITVTVKLVNDTLQALRGLALLATTTDAPAWLDGTTTPNPTGLLSMQNGILDLEAVAEHKPIHLLHPTPLYFTQTALPFDFDLHASRPVQWLKFLDELWPDDRESIDALQEWFGYLLTTDTRQQKILFLVGPKRSGKGTIARILRELVGPSNVAGPTLGSLAMNFGLSPLLGKPVAVISDARLSGRTDAAVIIERLLSISGEDAQTIDRKHRDPITTKLPTRFVILSNELPRLTDASGAFAGRLILLRLVNSWFGKEDHDLSDRLRDELPGILTWAIAGWRRLRRRGRFIQPDSGNELVEEMESITSPVGEFIREKYKVVAGAEVVVDELYQDWRDWCLDHGREHPGTKESFGRDLFATVPTLKKTRPRAQDGTRYHAYSGIRTRTTQDDTEDERRESGHAGHSGHCVSPMHAYERGEGEEEDDRGAYRAAMNGHPDLYDQPDQLFGNSSRRGLPD
jgi:putative DNA primase/helicase